MIHNIKIEYDPRNNKSIYKVDNKEFIGKFWDESSFKEGAFNPFYEFLRAANISQAEIEEIKPSLENGDLTTADITDNYFGVDVTEFLSEII